jgi:hypothetical protein
MPGRDGWPEDHGIGRGEYAALKKISIAVRGLGNEHH